MVASAIPLGRLGIWSGELRYGDAAEALDAAAELDELGYGTLWVPGGLGGDVFGAVRAVLGSTRRAAVATGILNIWMHDAAEVAADHAAVAAAWPGRFLLGLGISHALLVDADPSRRYDNPLEVTAAYLDRLDAAPSPVPDSQRVIAALGPRMLDLAGARSAGTHPYLVAPEHTRVARERLGPEALVAPEQGVVLERDPARAREAARAHLSFYLQLPNYTNNFRRIGFGDADLADGGSDRLVDGIVAWGDEDAIMRRVQEHWDAGADHVCLQVLRPPGETGMPRDAWRALAPGAAPG